MGINETLKQKIDELDLDRRLNEAVVQVERTLTTALDRASEYASSHHEDLQTWIDRAGSGIEKRTDGRFAEPVARAQARARLAVSKLAERGDAGSNEPPPPM